MNKYTLGAWVFLAFALAPLWLNISALLNVQPEEFQTTISWWWSLGFLTFSAFMAFLGTLEGKEEIRITVKR